MTMVSTQTAEKRYQATYADWDDVEEEYFSGDEIAGPDSRYGLDGWDTLAEFREWLAAEKAPAFMFLWDMWTEDRERVLSNTYPEVTFLTMDEDRWAAPGVPKVGF